MAAPDSDFNDMAAADKDANDYSVFSQKFDITSMKTDLIRWNGDWDKVSRTLSAKDAFAILDSMWNRGGLDTSAITSSAEALKDRVCHVQKLVAKLWDDMENDEHFVTAWLLLKETGRQDHLLKGLEEACKAASFSQDLRAMCPEIKISSMLKGKGKAYTNFISNYAKGKKAAGDDNIYYLPSKWWELEKAVDASELPSQRIESTFNLLTIQRNEFICRSFNTFCLISDRRSSCPAYFLLHATMSVLHDLSHGSASMDPVIDILKSSGVFASSLGKTLKGMAEKPLIRCENCIKSPEDIGGDIKFMLCSTCKAKLDFAVHYCSK
jgi:hypothetical protein